MGRWREGMKKLTRVSALSPRLPSPYLPVTYLPISPLPISLSPLSLSPYLPLSLSPYLPISLSPYLPVFSVFNFGDHLHASGDLQAANLYGC
jgi:hypothetical protein